MSTSSTSADASHEHTIKETIISLLISFVMALVFRSYVVEAFVIPTGSMAPTLLGKHTLHRSDHTGYEWAQNPTYLSSNRLPFPVQGIEYGKDPISATDPMTTSKFNQPSDLTARRNGVSTQPGSKRLLSGDRILVQKYLYNIFPPTRYDVVVFKNPTNPSENFIKRLIGLPNEQVLIADGDIFSRPLDAGGEPTGDGMYKIRRKPHRIMESLWRTIFSSEYTPRDAPGGFKMPWRLGESWDARDGTLVHEGSGESRIEWDAEAWPVWDWEPYNEAAIGTHLRENHQNFPVSDVRVRAGVEPANDGTDVAMSIIARGHEFEARIVGTDAIIRMRRAGANITPGEWTTVASGTVTALSGGRVTDLEFWHYDQKLELHVDGQIVVEHEYDWDASQRLMNTTGNSRDWYETNSRPDLRKPQSYTRSQPTISMSFGGGPVTLHRAGLDRDIYHRPVINGARSGHATHPQSAIKLGPDQFFTLGDNSAASSDGRAWFDVNSQVADQIDGTLGVVNRDLMLGKAFFVYFPSIYKIFDKIPVPNAGDMRLIR